MTKSLLKTIGLFCFCTTAVIFMPGKAQAAPVSPEYQTSSAILLRVDETDTELYSMPWEDAEVVGQADKGSTYTVLEQVDGNWVKVSDGSVEGYLNTAGITTTSAETAEEIVDSSASRRGQVVEYALQFVGNRYIYGGTNPNTGADCSGFTSYVLRNSAGVSLSHSSRAQAGEGRAISAEEIRPGDLVFYSQGKRINHVALYIGDGQIVHASNPSNGILVSRWDYRTPVRVVNVLGD